MSHADPIILGYVSDAPFGDGVPRYGQPLQQGPWNLQFDPWAYGQTNPWLQPWGQKPWWDNPSSPFGPAFMQGATVAGVPGVRRVGRMRAQILAHGGQEAVLGIMDGMVTRNERAIRAGYVPPLDQALSHGIIRYVEEPTWRDAPAALLDKVASAGTLAAWRAAEKRVAGDVAGLVLVRGVPVVAYGDPAHRSAGLQIEDPSLAFGRTHRVTPNAVQGLSPSDGEASANILFIVDDEQGLPIMEFGNKIAEHNAKQIAERGLPKLYDAGVHYSNENGELWLDAQGIVDRGTDDCEGLAAYRAGELALERLRAGVVTRIVPTQAHKGMGGGGGGRLFHAVTGVIQNGRLEYDDPSARLGMPVPEYYKKYAASRRARGLPL